MFQEGCDKRCLRSVRTDKNTVRHRGTHSGRYMRVNDLDMFPSCNQEKHFFYFVQVCISPDSVVPVLVFTERERDSGVRHWQVCMWVSDRWRSAHLTNTKTLTYCGDTRGPLPFMCLNKMLNIRTHHVVFFSAFRGAAILVAVGFSSSRSDRSKSVRPQWRRDTGWIKKLKSPWTYQKSNTS